MKNGFVATAVAIALASTGLMGAQGGIINGTAKDQAKKKDYADYTVRARDIGQGQIGGTSPLDADGRFSLANLGSANYLVELVNKDGKVVCTEGPFDLSTQEMRDNVTIDCNKVPAAWWLLGAAAAAGITAGVVAQGPASGSR